MNSSNLCNFVHSITSDDLPDIVAAGNATTVRPDVDDMLAIGLILFGIAALNGSQKMAAKQAAPATPVIVEKPPSQEFLVALEQATIDAVDLVGGRADLIPGGILPPFEARKLGKLSSRRGQFIQLPTEYSTVRGHLGQLTQVLGSAAFVLGELALRGYQFACPAYMLVLREIDHKPVVMRLDYSPRAVTQSIGASAVDVLVALATQYLMAANDALHQCENWERNIGTLTSEVQALLNALDLEVATQVHAAAGIQGQIGSPDSLAKAWKKVSDGVTPISELGKVSFESGARIHEGASFGFPRWWTGESITRYRRAMAQLWRCRNTPEQVEAAMSDLVTDITDAAVHLGNESGLISATMAVVKVCLESKAADQTDYGNHVAVLSSSTAFPSNPTTEQTDAVERLKQSILRFVDRTTY